MPKKISNYIFNEKKYFIHFFKPDNIKILEHYDFYDIKKINKIKKNSIKTIFLYDLLGYISQQDILPVMHDIIDKLCDRGDLYIQDNDIKLLCSSYLSNQINSVIYKNITYGNGKINCGALSDVKEILYSIPSISVVEIKFLNAFQYYIQCQKI
jgi:hypothetical protein